MSWLMAKLYDRVMRPTEEACLAEWRSELLSAASGDVLEIGSGTGVNVGHYTAVDSVTFTEPEAPMREQLVERLRFQERPWDYRVLDVPAEELPFADASFDTVVAMLVLCTVREPDVAVAELERVLTPGGRLIFIEHVAAEHGTRRHLYQRIVEPVWKRVAGNCHLTRATEETIAGAGFQIESVERASMRKAPAFVRPTIRGIATKPTA